MSNGLQNIAFVFLLRKIIAFFFIFDQLLLLKGEENAHEWKQVFNNLN